MVAADLRKEENCVSLVETHMSTFGVLDALYVNSLTELAILFGSRSSLAS